MASSPRSPAESVLVRHAETTTALAGLTSPLHTRGPCRIRQTLLQRAHVLEAEAAVLPLQIGEWAETCRLFVKEALKLELDYTPDTLPLLDHYVRTKAQAPSTEVRDLLAPPLGAYFGEVVRRSMQGVRWHAPDEHYELYRLEFEAVFLHFNPLGIAAEALAGEDVEGFGAHFQILDESREIVEEALARNDDRDQRRLLQLHAALRDARVVDVGADRLRESARAAAAPLRPRCLPRRFGRVEQRFVELNAAGCRLSRQAGWA